MAYFSVTGPSQAEEGSNITLTVRRQGDLSQTATLLANNVQWGNYSLDSQMGFQSDQESVNQRRIIFAPGQAMQTISYQVYDDGEPENWEYSFTQFLPINDLGDGRFAYDNSSTVSTNLGSKTWGTKIYDFGTLTPEPTTPISTVTQSTPLATQTVSPISAQIQSPVVPPIITNVNVDNSVSYTDNSIVNNYINSFNTDNSVTTITDNSINDSFNTDNSISMYSLNYVVNANDYSIGKNISGVGKLAGTDSNDLITGSKGNDRLYGEFGNDELIGGQGKDSFYGGLGSNILNAGTSASKKDADRLYIQREENAVSADIIESIGKSDRIFIQGSAGDLNVSAIDGGLGIFDNDVLQAIYTGNNFNASTLSNQLVAA